jgi:hypothetical protein
VFEMAICNKEVASATDTAFRYDGFDITLMKPFSTVVHVAHPSIPNSRNAQLATAWCWWAESNRAINTFTSG